MKFLGKFLLFIGTMVLVLLLIYKNYNLSIFIEQIGEQSTMDDQDKFIGELRQAMLERSPSVTLNFKGSAEDVHSFVSDAINRVFEIDDPDTNLDFDYLRYTYKGTEITIKGLFNAYQVEYKLSYNETKPETDKVLSEAKAAIKKMKLKKLDDYDKIKKIHDYIIKNATYDISAIHSSGYDNLIEKTSVCQGYAMITYLMMKEAGIDCRIITGSGKGVSHAWNIVKLNDKWYNIDTTWDDPVSNDGKQHLEYDYFLKSDDDFINHIREFEFQSTKFQNKYKMADISY